MNGVRVLVVDDERKIRELVGSYLEREGYTVTLAATGRAGLDAAVREHPDLIVLDLRLPDIAGEDVARSIREVSPVPIIMLTAKSAEDDRVTGLRIGADDYLVKPFSVRELGARVEAVLRRTRDQRRRVSFGGGRLVVDRAARAATVDGRPVGLTRTELDLLLALVDNAGRVLTRDQLMTLARGFEADVAERTVDAHMKNLRHKLGDDPHRPHYVETVQHVGYRFAAEPDA
jgi:two-component system, OmpR family, response regulator RegX3